MYFDPGTTKLPELGPYPMQPELAAKLFQLLDGFEEVPDAVTADMTGTPVCVWHGRNEVQLRVAETDLAMVMTTFPDGHIEAKAFDI